MNKFVARLFDKFLLCFTSSLWYITLTGYMPNNNDLH